MTSHQTWLYPRGYRDLNPTRKVGFFFSANVGGLTDYVIRHHFLIRRAVLRRQFPGFTWSVHSLFSFPFVRCASDGGDGEVKNSDITVIF